MKNLFFIIGIFCLFTLSSADFTASLATPLPDCSRAEGSFPTARLPGQVDSKNPVDHIIVIMQENHSFDSYFGRLNQTQFYGSEIDGVTDNMFNLDQQGRAVHVYHENNLCITDTDHSWNGEHQSWDSGLNDHFVSLNGPRTMAYYDQTEIPYYYALANQFAVADRYFCSALTSTFPNRYFLYAGTSFGHIKNDKPIGPHQFTQKTIFDSLDQFNVSWKYYTDDIGYLQLFIPMWTRDNIKMAHIADYYSDLKSGTLPQVVFIDAAFDGQDEHPAADVQRGQEWVSDLINGLISSSSWKTSALFLTYDENGGFYDHVIPPAACVPDQIQPHLATASMPGTFDHYGFRVPFILVSPFAKHHYVSHKTYDHTSILKFIETKFNLPALSVRDANADGMFDLFDFDHPTLTLPTLPSGTANPSLLCKGSIVH